MGFEQGIIKIDRTQEFQELKDGIERTFRPESIGQFLKRVQSAGLRVRDLDLVLARGIFEDVDETLAKAGKTAQSLYKVLTVSDQAQIREFYLSRVEEVATEWRARFQKVYRYY